MDATKFISTNTDPGIFIAPGADNCLIVTDDETGGKLIQDTVSPYHLERMTEQSALAYFADVSSALDEHYCDECAQLWNDCEC